MIVDLLRLAWLVVVAAVMMRIFGAGRRGIRHDPAAAIAHVARAVLVCVVVVNVLSRLHVFNAATMLIAWTAWPAARWLTRHCWDPERAIRAAMRRLVLEAVRRFEEPVLIPAAVRRVRRARRRVRACLRIAGARLDALHGGELLQAAAATAITAAAIDLRFAPVFGEPRLGHPELYGVLLAAREAAFNAPSGLVGGLGAVAAALSSMAALHPLHVIRLLIPLIGVALVFAGALLVKRATGSGGAALVTLAGLAVPWTLGNVEAAALLVVLAAIAAVARTPASRVGSVAAACAAVAVLLSGVTARELSSLFPVAVALIAGFAVAGIAALVRRVSAMPLDAIAAPAACAALVLLVPQTPRAMYLEHRAAQEQALAITSERPRGRWMIVAPIEQLAEAYGRGWYEEPAAFVERYAGRVGDPRFHFEYSVDEIFVFVEKRPYKTFATEPADVPFSTLSDPTYLNYRSTAGRASLQARLFLLCRAYARTHAGVSLYHDDDVLAIYRFRLGG